MADRTSLMNDNHKAVVVRYRSDPASFLGILCGHTGPQDLLGLTYICQCLFGGHLNDDEDIGKSKEYFYTSLSRRQSARCIAI